ncbi:hypothetical protein J6590_046504 [Homalodisca vitripennis]|nr:hypothetical protein J6590_046504 [Homalodisca vitripennis]
MYRHAIYRLADLLVTRTWKDAIDSGQSIKTNRSVQGKAASLERHKQLLQRQNYAWLEIADELIATKADVKTKIRNLTTQFKRENKKTKSGSGVDSEKRKWFALDHLMFLKDTTAPRHCRDTAKHDSMPEKVSLELASNALVFQRAFHQPSIDQGLILLLLDPHSQMTQVNIDESADTTLDTPSPGPSTPLQSTLTKPPKRRRYNPVAQEVLSVMKNLGDKLKPRDEFDAFGEYVAGQLRKCTDLRQMAVTKHRINQALFDLEIASLPSNQPTPNTLRLQECHMKQMNLCLCLIIFILMIQKLQLTL